MFEIVLLTVGILLILFGFIIIDRITEEGRWGCVFGEHKYTYVGQKYGMTITDNGKLLGSQRDLYKCTRCGKDKPIEEEDYV